MITITENIDYYKNNIKNSNDKNGNKSNSHNNNRLYQLQ